MTGRIQETTKAKAAATGSLPLRRLRFARVKPGARVLALGRAPSVYIPLIFSAPLVTASSPRGPVSTCTAVVDEGRTLTTSVSDLVLVIGTVLALRVTDIFTVQDTGFLLVFFVFCVTLLGLSSATRKGFCCALTCVRSLYMLLKTLLIFHNSKLSPHRGNVEQVQAPDESNQDKSFHNQNMCNKEGLQIDKR